MTDDWRKYQGDAAYAAWRMGYNPDVIDRDRLHDQFYDGIDADDAAAEQCRRIRNAGGLDLFYY